MTAENWYSKIADLSFQFEIEQAGKVSFRGICWFFTNSNGQYEGHYLRKRPTLPPDFDPVSLNDVGQSLCETLANSVFSELHRGPLGIDALLFRNEYLQPKLHPCLEINPRYTMGQLALVLEARIHPEATGEFRIQYLATNQFEEFVEKETKKYPPIEVDGFVRKGFFALNQGCHQSRFIAFLRLF